MMYRSGWAQKEGQEHVLAIKIKRSGWEWALKNSCLSHFSEAYYPSHESWKALLEQSPVRIQWDPEKDIHFQKLYGIHKIISQNSTFKQLWLSLFVYFCKELYITYKSIQVGLSGIAIEKYAKEWTLQIEDISEKCKEIHQILINGEEEKAKMMLPQEEIYPIPLEILQVIKSSSL